MRSIMGTKTLLSMQQFIERAEPGCESEVAELDAKRAKQDCVKALKQLFKDFESQLTDSEGEAQDQTDQLQNPVGYHLLSGMSAQVLKEDELDEGALMFKEPQLYLCDDWIRPVEVIKKPRDLPPQDKHRAREAKNFLLVTLTSLNVGYGSVIDSYLNEGVEQRSPVLNYISLTEEEAQTRRRGSGSEA